MASRYRARWMVLVAAALHAFLVGVLATPAEAGIVYPDSDRWTALTTGGGNVLTDPDGPNPDTTDVIGDATYAAGFVAYDDANSNLLFRMRIDRSPNNATAVWQILIDSDMDSDVDWVLQLDESGDNQVELNSVTTGGPDFDDVVISTTATWSGSSATYSQIIDVDDGSTFGSATDVFVDILIPFSDFNSATGLGTSDTFRVAITTSTTHSGINKEYPGSLSSTSAVSSGWGDSFAMDDVAVPEPGTWSLFALGLVVLGVQRRRRRRRTADAPPVA